MGSIKKLILPLILVLATLLGLTLESKNIVIAENTTFSKDWTMFQYNAAHSGSPDNIVPASYDLLWKFDTLNSSESYAIIISSSPAVVNDVIYVGSDNGIAYALNATSGILLWSSKLGTFACASPAIVGGIAYFDVWDGYVYALNASTGGTMWKASTGYLGSCSPAVANGILCVGSGTGDILAFNASTGTKIWSYPTISRIEAPPIISDGFAYAISSNGNLYALNVSNGECKWIHRTSVGNAGASPAISGGIVYAGADDDGSPYDSAFYALNASTGTQIWSHIIGSAGYSSPAVAGGTVYVGTLMGNFFALNAYTGAEIWRFQPGGSVKSSAAVADDFVYIGSENGTIYALNASTGAKFWSYATGNAGISSSPIVVKGILYVKNDDGFIYAFGKAVKPSISLSQFFGVAGSNVTVAGSGFATGSTVTATFGSSSISLSGSINVDSLGHFSITFTVPSTSGPGNYAVTLTDGAHNSGTAQFQIIATPTTSWPMSMHDLQHSGSADTVAPVNNNTLWTFEVDRGAMVNGIASNPAVVGGIVYIGSQNCYVYALDAYTGVYYWRFNTGGISLCSSPIVVDGAVYVGTESSICAVNAYSGEEIWSSPINMGQFSTPTVSGGIVYIGSFGGTYYAFNASTGKSIWTFATDGYAESSPAVVGGTVYVGSMDGYVYALNALTGKLIWNYSTGPAHPFGGVASSPAVLDGTLYIATDNGIVFALNATNGNRTWVQNITESLSVTSSPTVANGLLYIAAGNRVYAFNATTGGKMWNFTSAYPMQTTPAIVDGVVYVTGNDGNVYALNAYSGISLWNYSTGSSIRVSVAIANGVVYVGATNGKVYAIGTPQSTPIPEFSPNQILPLFMTITLLISMIYFKKHKR